MLFLLMITLYVLLSLLLNEVGVLDRQKLFDRLDQVAITSGQHQL
jgi:hypothetical protein